MDATTLTIGEAAAALRRGETTALAYADALLAQAARATGLNAFIHHDPEQVRRRRARRRCAQARRGAALGPLHGVPLALKDNLDTADMPTTGGTPGLRGHRPKRNAAIVQKLRDAGAIVFGKANLHELAYGITNNNAAFGAARNPYDRTRIPGGSSGGVGVAVGARHGAGRHRLRHRRLGADAGGAVRHRRLPADDRALVAGRHRADLAHPRHRRADDAQRRRLRAARRRRHRRRDVGRGGGAEGPAPRRAARALLGAARRRGRAADGRRAARALRGCRRGAGRGRHPPTSAALDGEAGFPIALYETVVDIDAVPGRARLAA